MNRSVSLSRYLWLTVCWALVALASGCSTRIPEPWAKLGLPLQGLDRVRETTSGDLFWADYRGCTDEQLIARVEGAMLHAGYARTCSTFEGRVRGYTKGADKLLVKVDSIGPVSTLSVGNKAGSDRLLYGVCFDGYQLGVPTRVK
ncbi:MAG TPA: hypothetical protein VK989_10640 [Polyangia bacterium]|jgi:hypothetical protein|nr:hypothetical protein [Polyangia bacterium]